MRLLGSIIALSIICLGTSSPRSAKAQGWDLTRMDMRTGMRTPMGMRTAMNTSMNSGEGDEPANSGRTVVLIRRYRTILERDPRETFAFQRLLDLYRERDGNVDAFVRELEASVAANESAYPDRMLLGHVYKSQTNAAAARQMYDAAAALRPDEPAPLLAVGRLVQNDEPAAARDYFSRALERTRGDTERRELLRELGGLALAASDFDGAAAYYQRYAGSSVGSIYMMTEYARALSGVDQHARAVVEYQRVLGRLRGDNRVLAPILKELAVAQMESGESAAAIESLRRALRLAGRGAGIRREIYDVMVEVYRRSDRLPELAELLSSERDPGAIELRGRIHDELGNEEEALEAYRAALRANRRDIDTRVRVIQLLSRSGRIDDVIAEYRTLVAASPREPRFVVELATLLMQVGRRGEALSLAARASARASRDTAVHQALAELYTRWGEDELAAREVAALVRIDPRDPGHLIALGEQQLDAGNESAALATWRRLLNAERDRAGGHAALASILADHDFLDEAEEHYRHAVRMRSDDVEFVRGLASVLERPRRVESAADRQRRDEEAVVQWQSVLSMATERAIRREARQRIVSIWVRRRELATKIRDWQRALAADPPDIEAGRFLAEAHLRQRPRDAAAAERVLARITELEPGDIESLLALERVKTARGDLEGAMAVLERLVEADPRRATRYLQTMAEHAHALYRDGDAVRLAAEAVSRSPDDAEGHRRLGDLHRARQDVDSAIASYRRAIEINERLFPTYFDLAEILIAKGDGAGAARLYREVLRLSPDDDLVARAGRAAIQLHLGDQTLDELEQTLLPLALAHARRPIFRKLAVELYDSLTAPLIQATYIPGDGAEEAQAELHRLGVRAIKPLLEALADPDPSQNGIAIEVLGHLGNANAAGPLLAIAESDAPTALRLRALAGAASLADERLAPRLIALTESPEQRLQPIATWALARVRGRRALAQLRQLATSGNMAVRTYALIGLGADGGRFAEQAEEAIVTFARHPAPLAASLWALGRLGEARHVAILREHLRRTSPVPAAAAAIALGRFVQRGIAVEEARTALTEALFATDESVRAAAGRALRDDWRDDVLPLRPDANVDRTVFALLARSGGHGAGTDPGLAPALRASGRAALQGPIERVSAVLARVDANGQLDVGSFSPELFAGVVPAWADEIAALHDHPNAEVRERVARILGTLSGSTVEAALGILLQDSEGPVIRAALRSVGRVRAMSASTRAAELLQSEDWTVRLEAARTLGALNEVAPLIAALESDAYAYVREAAAQALSGHSDARDALQRAQSRDPEPIVRAAASAALTTE